MKEHREAACANESEKYCVRKACDCVCVCLNYLAQRPDRGVNEVRSSLLQHFPSPSSISTPSTHQPCSSSSSSSIVFAVELLVYSASLNKQELSNKRPYRMLLTSPQLLASHEGRSLIKLNADTVSVSLNVCFLCGPSEVNLLNSVALKGSFKGICSLNEPLKLMKCVLVRARACARVVGRVGILQYCLVVAASFLSHRALI